MKFWKYGRVVLALMGSIVLGLSITCCGVYTSGYMYVTGQQYNQIAAYKIDHDFGYLTPVTGSPFASGGANPVQEAILPGGRFLAVVNRGTNGTGGGVSIFTIGGAGVLFFQATYATAGINPISIAVSPSGSFLYILDQLAPDGSGRGDITVFQVDGSSGKLTLITNQNTFNTNGSQLPYFEVNYKPVQVVTDGSYVYALDQAYNLAAGTSGVPAACVAASAASGCSTPDVFLYQANSSTGQLTLTQNQPLTTGSLPGALSTIAVAPGGRYVYIADTANGANNGRILPFTIGPGGVLQTLVGGPVPNSLGASNYPDAILANSNSQFLYVANYGPGSIQQPMSNISAFTIDTANGQLQQITLQEGVYSTGSGPIWLAEDPTNQYLYSVNYNDNTITGKIIDATHGQLSPLSRGVLTQTVGQPTFMVVTSRTY